MAYYERPVDRPHRPVSNFGWPLLFLLLLVGVLVWRMIEVGGGKLHDPNAISRPVAARGNLAEDEQATIELFRKAAPSVVHITTLEVRRSLFSFNVTEIPQGTGSGFIWSDQGYVVTNYHVIQDAGAAKVTLNDKSTWDGRLVGVAPDKDLAVLKIDAPRDRLPPILVGSSSDLQVGQKVFAIGNPFGLDQTLTTGVISGLGREIESVTHRPIEGVIQTDAAINPGNSGGPLLDSAGRLIGINTAIYSPSGAYAGIGFAVPVDIVNRIIPQLVKNGKSERAGLGIRIADDQISRRLGLKGVLVLGFSDDSPAAKAGLRRTTEDQSTGEIVLGDQIIAVDQQPVHNSNDLFRALEKHKIGDTVAVTVRRDDAEKLLSVTLGPVP
jgi:S1-C subfamily serine protease